MELLIKDDLLPHCELITHD